MYQPINYKTLIITIFFYHLSYLDWKILIKQKNTWITSTTHVIILKKNYFRVSIAWYPNNWLFISTFKIGLLIIKLFVVNFLYIYTYIYKFVPACIGSAYREAYKLGQKMVQSPHHHLSILIASTVSLRGKMSSRAFLLLGLLAAFVLLFASEVAARDLAETTSADTNDGQLSRLPFYRTHTSISPSSNR